MTHVLLLFGGQSAEHEVSCISAVAILEALERIGLYVIPVGIDRDGHWWLADRSCRPLRAEGRAAILEVPQGVLKSSGDSIGFDIVFPVLHGPFGEDGKVQGIFDLAGIPYVGCGVKSSAIAMDKDIAKRLFRDAGLPVSDWCILRAAEFFDTPRVVDRIANKFGLPVFVKPAELGSSVGITRPTSSTELHDGIEAAFAFGDKVIIEEEIRGREIEVAVLEGPRVSIPGEIVLEGGWYTYEAKYKDATSEFITPAALTEAETETVRSYAARAFEIVEGKGLARVDFLLETPGRGFLINEVNTMPGFTPISGFPKMWEASGMSYPELCKELVDIALRA